ncbi:MAG TPA: C1 family peptidase [Gemmatimonadales bacterium]
MPARRRSASRKSSPRSPSQPGYGWVPDLPDHRDLVYGAVYGAPPSLPPVADLRPHCSPVENQGQLGSCTGNALAGALEYLEKKDGLPFVNLSRLFIYYNERVIEHTTKSDAGAMIRDGIKTLVKQGVCAEPKWPYRPASFAKRPAAACYKEALTHQVTSYQRITALSEMRACLASGFPFVFGFTVYEQFESPEVARTGVVHLPGPGERALGGHAVLAVGYDDAQRRFTVRNSWGAGWGMRGYFTIPYDYLANANLADDMWTIRRGEKL